MEITRDRFIEQLAIAFQVHCLRLWRRRSKEAPPHLSTCLYEWIRTNGGRMALAGPAFGELVRPVIEQLHRVTPQGERPDAKDLAGRLYDALAAADVEVTIAAPARAIG
jgi:hypothetical protein